MCKIVDGRGTKRNRWEGCKFLGSGRPTNEQEWNGVG